MPYYSTSRNSQSIVDRNTSHMALFRLDPGMRQLPVESACNLSLLVGGVMGCYAVMVGNMPFLIVSA